MALLCNGFTLLRHTSLSNVAFKSFARCFLLSLKISEGRLCIQIRLLPFFTMGFTRKIWRSSSWVSKSTKIQHQLYELFCNCYQAIKLNYLPITFAKKNSLSVDFEQFGTLAVLYSVGQKCSKYCQISIVFFTKIVKCSIGFRHVILDPQKLRLCSIISSGRGRACQNGLKTNNKLCLKNEDRKNLIF